MPDKTTAQLSASAKKAVRTRRRNHPGGSAERLNSVQVQRAFRRRKAFTTGEVMETFGAAVANATAVIAILRRKELVEKLGVAPDGTTSWGWA